MPVVASARAELRRGWIVTVYKYPLELTDESNFVHVLLPPGAKPLRIDAQRPHPALRFPGSGEEVRWMLWALVNPSAATREQRWFMIAGTGHAIPDDVPMEYLNTFLYGGSLVFHAFVVVAGVDPTK